MARSILLGLFVFLLMQTSSLVSAAELKFCKESVTAEESLKCVVKIEEEDKVYVGSQVLVYATPDQWVVAIGKVIFKKGSFLIALFEEQRGSELEKGQKVLFYNPADEFSYPLL